MNDLGIMLIAGKRRHILVLQLHHLREPKHRIQRRPQLTAQKREKFCFREMRGFGVFKRAAQFFIFGAQRLFGLKSLQREIERVVQCRVVQGVLVEIVKRTRLQHSFSHGVIMTARHNNHRHLRGAVDRLQ